MIALLGDSLSVGSFPSLQKLVPDASLFAKVGDPISRMAARIPAIQEASPTHVLLMGGTNDLADTNVSVDTIFERLSTLANKLKSLGYEVIVSTIPPQRSSNNERVKDYNQRILYGALGENIRVADVGGVVSVDDLSADGLHPNLTTYRRMGEAWAKAYEASLVPKTEESTYLLDIERDKGSSLVPIGLAAGALFLFFTLKKR